MNPPSNPPGAPAPTTRSARRRKYRDAALVVGLVAAVLVAGPATFALLGYYTAQTTVTVTLVSWRLPPFNGTFVGSDVSRQQCATRARPGSTYASSVYLSYGTGQNVSLSAPGPFALVSTSPTLPSPVPSGGLQISFVLRYPETPGTYSFTGSIVLS